MFTQNPIAFTPAQRQFRIGLLLTNKNGDFDAISVTERSCAVPISKVGSHISDRCSYDTGERFVSAQKAVWSSVIKA